MPALPWTQRQAVDPGRTYLAMASCLPLTSCRSIPRISGRRHGHPPSARPAHGMIGYALDAEPRRKTFWTFSVWGRPGRASRASPLGPTSAHHPTATAHGWGRPGSSSSGHRIGPPMTWDEMKAPLRSLRSPDGTQ